MEDDVRAAIMQMNSPITRNSSKTNLEAKNAKSAVIWTLRRVILIILLVLELTKWAGELSIEYLIQKEFFGVNPDKNETKDEIDLDDTLQAIMTRIFIELFIGALILPHIIAHFLPQLRAISGNTRNV